MRPERYMRIEEDEIRRHSSVDRTAARDAVRRATLDRVNSRAPADEELGEKRASVDSGKVE